MKTLLVQTPADYDKKKQAQKVVFITCNHGHVFAFVIRFILSFGVLCAVMLQFNNCQLDAITCDFCQNSMATQVSPNVIVDDIF